MFEADIPESGQGATIDCTPIRSRRRDRRTKTGYGLVKLEHEHNKTLALCQNISDGGMKLYVSIPLGLNDRVTITLSAAELSGRVVWVNGNDCGIAFDQPVDCARLLNALPEGEGSLKRASRLHANIPATIAVRGEASKAVVRGIPVRGIQIANDSNFHPGLRVRVILANGYEREGIVRWSRNDIAGVLLLQPV